MTDRVKLVQVLEQRQRMNNPTSIRDLFSLPGFVAASRLIAVFGDCYARVLVLRRRKTLHAAHSVDRGAAAGM